MIWPSPGSLVMILCSVRMYSGLMLLMGYERPEDCRIYTPQEHTILRDTRGPRRASIRNEKSY
jgi:hypothetical protein